MSLNDTLIRNSKGKLKDYKLSDGGGLFLLIKTSGAKWWRYSYRFNGMQKTISLGVYPEISLKEARLRHQDARSLLARGTNPSEDRKRTKATNLALSKNSFELIAREWIGSNLKLLSDGHKDRILRRLELYIFPWIGKKPISEISAPEVLECIKRIQSLNKLETATRTLQACGQVFRYAVQSGLAIRDITADLKGVVPSSRVKHMPTFTEPKKVAELLKAMEGFTGTYTVQCALKLAPLVFVRPGELRTAKWKDIDLDNAEWSYRVSKTKTDHLVPLSTQAIGILKDMKNFSGEREFVFPGGHDPKKPMSEAAINAALKRMGYDTKTEITGHGFRAMARTILHERLGIEPAVIEHQLAHKVPGPLGAAYDRTKFIDQRKKMMQQWADYLDALKADKGTL